MGKIKSVLNLDKLFFDEIKFNKIGFGKDNKPEINLKGEIAVNENTSEEKRYRVKLSLRVDKPEEYELMISLVGIFSFDSKEELDVDTKKRFNFK